MTNLILDVCLNVKMALDLSGSMAYTAAHFVFHVTYIINFHVSTKDKSRKAWAGLLPIVWFLYGVNLLSPTKPFHIYFPK